MLLAACTVMAAEPDVQALRTDFSAKLASASLPVLEQQLASIIALERKAADATDYASAQAASEEKKRLQSIIAEFKKVSLLAIGTTAVTSRKNSPSIILKPADARDGLSGVRIDPETGLLTDWSKPGASATWKLSGLAPGGYEVILKYESGALEGGSIVVEEKFFMLSATLQTTLNGPMEHRLGVLRIRDGDGTLKITAKTVLKGNLMRLHSVELLPVNRSTND